MSPLPGFFASASCGRFIYTPLRGFLCPLQIAAFDSACQSKAHLLSCPISLRSPPAIRFYTFGLRIIVPGSLLLFRFDCSVNLLEP